MEEADYMHITANSSWADPDVCHSDLVVQYVLFNWSHVNPRGRELCLGTFLLMFPENMCLTAELENNSGGFHGGSNAVVSKFLPDHSRSYRITWRLLAVTGRKRCVCV